RLQHSGRNGVQGRAGGLCAADFAAHGTTDSSKSFLPIGAGRVCRAKGPQAGNSRPANCRGFAKIAAAAPRLREGLLGFSWRRARRFEFARIGKIAQRLRVEKRTRSDLTSSK